MNKKLYFLLNLNNTLLDYSSFISSQLSSFQFHHIFNPVARVSTITKSRDGTSLQEQTSNLCTKEKHCFPYVYV
ncbi:hypothetical protein QVD17_14816 [Tagetes erecta]|uniref:Uncharacterized protein n=1 Tax=Tagetes erecta TaxID=13708 RepID=A0AAD8KTP4_TARER|nr:hypothetical protein QVD17_14816 [Tagetes erecta]